MAVLGSDDDNLTTGMSMRPVRHFFFHVSPIKLLETVRILVFTTPRHGFSHAHRVVIHPTPSGPAIMSLFPSIFGLWRRVPAGISPRPLGSVISSCKSSLGGKISRFQEPRTTTGRCNRVR
jgi:hypothetical protein